jgi:hypothetical protein
MVGGRGRLNDGTTGTQTEKKKRRWTRKLPGLTRINQNRQTGIPIGTRIANLVLQGNSF